VVSRRPPRTSARRTGFSHMFEHVMFTGSLNVAYACTTDDGRRGRGSNNGSTTNDRTNYYETDSVDYLETSTLDGS